MKIRTITEETIAGLLNEERMSAAEFGVIEFEVRVYGYCHSSDISPCEHTEDTCLLKAATYRADGRGDLSHDHCALTCPNLWDSSGEIHGIGGSYQLADGLLVTFSDLGDEPALEERVYARAAVLIGQEDA